MSKEAIIPAGTYYSDQFEFTNQELRRHVKLANSEIDNVKDKVNELVVIVHDDNPHWKLKKICAYIAGKNDDLEEYGFSARTIYNYLDEQNRKLVDKRYQSQRKPKPIENQPSKSLEKLRNEKGTIEQNNVMEQEGEGFHPNVLEESSISDNDEPIIDPKLLDQKIEQIAELEKEKQELQDTLQTIKKEKVESAMSRSSTIEYSIELSDQDLIDIRNNGGIAPLLLTSYPDKNTVTAKLDRMRLQQKKKR